MEFGIWNFKTMNNKIKIEDLIKKTAAWFRKAFEHRFLIYKSIGTLAVIILIAAGFVVWYTSRSAKPAVAGWYSDWSYRKKITIDADQVWGNETNFPILATTTDSDLRATSSSGHVEMLNAHDILFTLADGVTKINYEREKYSSTTGQLVAWLQVPDLSSSTDTVLYMYYGNSSASDQATTTGVWNSNYKGVWHLPDNAGNAKGDVNASTTDSTMYDNDGAAIDNASSSEFTFIDGAFELDGTGDYIQIADSSSLEDITNMTVSVWFKAKSFTGYDILLAKGCCGGGYWWVGMLNTDFNTGHSGGGQEITVTANLSIATWYHYVAVFDDTNNQRLIYKDGSLIDDRAWTGSIPETANNPFYIGRTQFGEYFNGIIDEVRISNTARDAEWIKTSYNNQVNVAKFLTFDSEAAAGEGEPVTRRRHIFHR